MHTPFQAPGLLPPVMPLMNRLIPRLGIIFLAAIPSLGATLPQPNPTLIQPMDWAESSLEDSSVSLIAQAQPANTILYFDTSTRSIRLFRQGDQILMNVFNRATDSFEQNSMPTAIAPRRNDSDYFTSYVSYGANNGAPVAYYARVNANNQTQFQIVNSNGDSIVSEDGVNTYSNLPTNQRPTSPEVTLITFDTHDNQYSVRVYEQGGTTRMNVYNRPRDLVEVNGVTATRATPRNSNDTWISYLASVTRNGGPVNYYARVNANRLSELQIVAGNGQVLSTHPGTATIVNLPVDEVNRPYVVAVPGDISTLANIQQVYPEASLESSRQGSFVNAGAFANRDAAYARMYALRGIGYDARVLYRQVEYR